MKITILGNPPSDNLLYGMVARGKRVVKFMTKKCKTFKNIARLSVKEPNPTKRPIMMNINVYFGDRRKRDIQGHLKCLIDALQGLLYEDDSQIISLTATKYYDKKIPRSEVTILELEDEVK